MRVGSLCQGIGGADLALEAHGHTVAWGAELDPAPASVCAHHWRRMMGWVRRWLRRNAPTVSTLVSYSDPVHGHTGTLYRASGWTYTPTHHGDRYDANGKGYPSGHGSWDGVTQQSPKHRWTAQVRP